ncbi:MAG: type II secretion system protein GspD, partial [Ignavibacteria bacterium]
MKNIVTYFVISLFIVLQASAQEYWERRFKTSQNPDELVTMSETLPFDQAIELLSKVSESVSGRRIVATVQRNEPIGIEITNMPYDKALLMIVNYSGLEYEIKEDVVIVRAKGKEEFDKTPDTYAPLTQREVRISAVFCEIDVVEARKVGFDWRFLLAGEQTNVAGVLRSETERSQTGGGQQQQGLPPEFKLGVTSDFRIGDFFGQATAVFKFFEENNLGEIISNPSIVVRDRNEGKIQIGSDFSVRTRDFAGNTTERFFPTGTIIIVTPYIHKEGGLDYALLNISVERSSFQTSELTTEIRKTTAATQVLMLNGEETAIGGLFLNEELVVRNGIPFLKDLPWWVFGIRYLTGYDQTTVRKKELVILLKTELIPTLQERFENPQWENVIKRDMDGGRNRTKDYQFERSGEGRG